MTDTHAQLASLAAVLTDKTSEREQLVGQWNPPFCDDVDIRICRDGHWEYQGSPVSRESMVRLFASVLRRDNNGCFYLVTPVEKVRIRVEDKPFLITGFEQQEGYLVLLTNVGDQLLLGPEHPLLPGDPAPCVRVRNGLEARLHRNVYYQLIELAETREQDGAMQLCVSSGGAYYSLGNSGKTATSETDANSNNH